MARGAPHDTLDAFISYSIAADGHVAPAVEHGLERLARPWNRLRAISVFRDQTDLSLTPHLWETISGRLDQARYLVLLVCPEAAASYWVQREVAHWCDTKGADHVMLVWTGGHLKWDKEAGDFTPESTAIPATLRNRFAGEPLYLDLRWAREAPELSLRLSTFRGAIAQVAAPIRNTSPDLLEGEDIRMHRRARRLARAAVAGLAVLTVVALIAAGIAVANARRADQRTREAVARQVGLAALDAPASDIDQALLMSLASASLANPRDTQRFLPTQVLIGRYSRLDAILHLGGDGNFVNVRDVGLSGDGTRAFATVGSAKGAISLARWDDPAQRRAETETAPTDVGTEVETLNDGASMLIGADGGGWAVADAEGRLRTGDGVMLSHDRWSARAWVATSKSQVQLVALDTGSPLAVVGGNESARTAVGAGRSAVWTAGTLQTFATGSGAAEATAAAAADVAVMATGPVDSAAVVGISTERQLLRWERAADALSLAQTLPLPATIGQPRWLVVGPTGRYVVVVGATATALIDLVDGSSTPVPGAGATVAAVDPSGRFVAIGGSRLSVWDLANGARVIASPQVAAAVAWSGPCDAAVRCKVVAAGVSIDVFDPIAETQLRLVDEISAQSVAISADGAKVVSGGWGTTIEVWNVAPSVDNSVREEVAPVAANPPPSACPGDVHATSPDDHLVASVEVATVTVRVCRADTGARIAIGNLNTAFGHVDALAVDDEGGVALGRADGFVEYYGPAPGKFVPGKAIDVRVGGEQVAVSALAVRGGVVVAGLRFVAASATPARVLVWGPTDGQPTTFATDFQDVAAVAVLDSGATAVIVAGRDSADGAVTIQLWDTRTRRRIGRAFAGLQGTITRLVGADTAVDGSDDTGHSYRWNLASDPNAEICAIAGRTMSAEEWQQVAGGALQPYGYDPPCG